MNALGFETAEGAPLPTLYSRFSHQTPSPCGEHCAPFKYVVTIMIFHSTFLRHCNRDGVLQSHRGVGGGEDLVCSKGSAGFRVITTNGTEARSGYRGFTARRGRRDLDLLVPGDKEDFVSVREGRVERLSVEISVDTLWMGDLHRLCARRWRLCGRYRPCIRTCGARARPFRGGRGSSPCRQDVRTHGLLQG